MSSFLISKIDYARAAGALAAIGESPRGYDSDSNPNFLRWNSKENKFCGSREFIADIMSLWDLNNISVARQYHEQPSEDSGAYRMEIATTFAHTNALIKKYRLTEDKKDKQTLKDLCYALRYFFDGVLYQIEDPEMAEKARRIIEWYSFQMLDYLRRLDCSMDESLLEWGGFDFFGDTF